MQAGTDVEAEQRRREEEELEKEKQVKAVRETHPGGFRGGSRQSD